jgi:hypothetical protein
MIIDHELNNLEIENKIKEFYNIFILKNNNAKTFDQFILYVEQFVTYVENLSPQDRLFYKKTFFEIDFYFDRIKKNFNNDQNSLIEEMKLFSVLTKAHKAYNFL